MNLNNGGKGGADTLCHRGRRFMSHDSSLLNIFICRHLQFINPTSRSVMPGVIMFCDGVSSGVCSFSSSLTDRPLNGNRAALQHDHRLKNALITVRRLSVWAASLISLACVCCQYVIYINLVYCAVHQKAEPYFNLFKNHIRYCVVINLCT